MDYGPPTTQIITAHPLRSFAEGAAVGASVADLRLRRSAAEVAADRARPLALKIPTAMFSLFGLGSLVFMCMH